MAPIGPTTFGVLLWGAIFAVAAIFAYQVYVLSRDYGLLGAAIGPDS
jgi:hypothetical protein